MFEIAGSTWIGDVERITLGHRVLGFSPMTVHCYRIGSTLVDCGPPNRIEELSDLVDVEGIEHVLLTHHHEDHVGAAPALAEAGATVQAPEPALPLLEDPPELEPYQYRVWGRPSPVEAQPVGKRAETPDGTFEVIPVPGHCPDHVALLETERGLLFTGDAYLPPRETLRADEQLDGILASLSTLGDLGADRLLPGHGSAVDAPSAAIDTVLEHLDDLAEQAHALADEGHDATTIRRRLLGVEGFIRYYTGGHYAKQNLVDELLALER